MIVITQKSDAGFYVEPGDVFHLTVSDDSDDFGVLTVGKGGAVHGRILITEEITVSKFIDFIAAYRFALEDGTCPGFHLTGIFGNSAELPQEIKEAKLFEELTPNQQKRFAKSIGVKIPRKAKRKPTNTLRQGHKGENSG